MNAKFLAIMKRYGELAQLVAAGKATEKEKGELDSLSKTVKAMTDPDSVDVGKTTIKTMTVAEFQKHVEAEQAAIAAAPDPARAALLKRNIDAVKQQCKTKLDETVAVYFPAEVTEEDRIGKIEATLAAVLTAVESMKAQFDGRTQSGVTDKPEGDAGDGGDASDGDDGEDADENSAAKGDAPTAQALSSEALDALISRFEALKSKLDAGTLKMEDVRAMWQGQWELETLVEAAAAILVKTEVLSELIGTVIPAVKALSKDEDAGDNDGNTEGNDDASDDDDDVEKGLVSGTDLSPAMGDDEMYGAVRKYKFKKHNK